MKRPSVTWAESAELLETTLKGSARREIVDAIAATSNPLAALRAAMKRNAFATASATLDLQRVVASLDAKSRQEGLHLVQAWDFGRHVFTDDSVPILLLDYCTRLPARKSDDHATVAVLLDQYFLTALSLLAVRAWDEGDANANLDRVTALLVALQGAGGSGHRFITDAESLLFLGISYFHPDEASYGQLLAKIEALDGRHQLRIAYACAGMMSAHLRWGLRFMYQRDVGKMRADNVVDYPWLSHAAATLARHYAGAAGPERVRLAEALLLALAADPWAFGHDLPPNLVSRAEDHAAVREVVAGARRTMFADFEAMRPQAGAYSPLSFTCNFPTNAAVALVAVTVEDGKLYVPLNALFTAREDPAAAQRLATRLMDYSVSDPSRLGAGQAPLIAFDPFDGASAFNAVVRELGR